MKKLLLSLLFLGFALTNYAQDAKKSFPLSSFDKLDMGSAFNIMVKQSNEFRVSARGQQDDIEDLIAKVENGELKIYFQHTDSRNWKNRKTIYIDIEMPDLKSAEFSGASKSKVFGFHSDVLNITVSGASSSTFDLDAKNLNADCSGASSMVLIGKGQKANFEVSGASNINALDFDIDTANVSASGASSSKLNVGKSLTVDASGASSVKYVGDASVRAKTSGASSVKRAN